jgi:hypothetical protein
MSWAPGSKEQVLVSKRQKLLYASRDPACQYHDFQFPARKGIDKRGHFAVAVGRRVYFDRGCKVFISAQCKHGVPSYLLEAMPGKQKTDDGYQLMLDVFGQAALDRFHSLAAEERRKYGFRSAGGDPDLFVLDPTDRFFVEVKLVDPPYADTLNEQQKLVFPLIEQELRCEVRLLVVRIVPEDDVVTS